MFWFVSLMLMDWWFFYLQKIGTSRLTTYLLRNGKNMLLNLFDVDEHSWDSNEMWWAKNWAHHNSIQDEVNDKEHEQLVRDGATRLDGWCLHVLTIFDPLTDPIPCHVGVDYGWNLNLKMNHGCMNRDQTTDDWWISGEMMWNDGQPKRDNLYIYVW